MNLCKRYPSLRSLAPPNECEKWEDTIAGCVVDGMFYLQYEYELIFRTQSPSSTYELYLSVYQYNYSPMSRK